jgi:flagellar biosynthesis protein FliQ
MPSPSDWLLIAVLPGLFVALGVVLLVVMKRAFRDAGPDAPAAAEPRPALGRRGLGMALVLGALAVVVALAALFVVVFQATRR